MKQTYRKILMILVAALVMLPCGLLLTACGGGSSEPKYYSYTTEIKGNEGKEIFYTHKGPGMVYLIDQGNELELDVSFDIGWEHKGAVIKIDGEDVTAKGTFWYVNGDFYDGSLTSITDEEPDCLQKRQWKYTWEPTADFKVELDVSQCQKATVKVGVDKTLLPTAQVWVLKEDVPYINEINEDTATQIEAVNDVFNVPYDSHAFLLLTKDMRICDVKRNGINRGVYQIMGYTKYHKGIYYAYDLDLVRTTMLWMPYVTPNSAGNVLADNLMTVLVDDDQSITYTPYTEQVISVVTPVTVNDQSLYPVHTAFRDNKKYMYVYLGDADNYPADEKYDENKNFYYDKNDFGKGLYLSVSPKDPKDKTCDFSVMEFVLADYYGNEVVIEPIKVGKQYYLIATREQLAPLCYTKNNALHGEIRVYGRLKASARANYVSIRILSNAAHTNQEAGTPYVWEYLPSFSLNGIAYCKRTDMCTVYKTETWNGTINLTCPAAQGASPMARTTIQYYDENDQLLYTNQKKLQAGNGTGSIIGGINNKVEMEEGQSADQVRSIVVTAIFGESHPDEVATISFTQAHLDDVGAMYYAMTPDATTWTKVTAETQITLHYGVPVYYYVENNTADSLHYGLPNIYNGYYYDFDERAYSVQNNQVRVFFTTSSIKFENVMYYDIVPSAD